MSRFLRDLRLTPWWPALLLSGSLHAATENVEVRLQMMPPVAEAWVPDAGSSDYNLLELRRNRPGPIEDRSDLEKRSTADTEEILWQARILALLQHHHLPGAADPDFLRADMAQLAHYFARYPAVRELFDDLAGTQWRWRYNNGDAETQVSGSRLRVASALVLFDPRAGAQFRFQRSCEQKVPYCFAAPADVLLHELLHVRAILRNTAVFIKQGGLNPHLYPHAHEQHTITQERQLYAGMTGQDRIPRPRRHDHSGRRISTSCATCLR